MRPADHVEALRADGARLTVAAAGAGLDAEVADCPGWHLRELVRHVGGVHRWAAWHLTSGASRRTTDEENAALFRQVPDLELLDWYHEGHSALVRALEEAEPSLECWTFLRAPNPLAFWARRQAHETAVHRADAEAASGSVGSFAPEFAADGIDELLTGLITRPGGGLVSDPPASLGVECTDTGDSWNIRVEPDRRVAVRGQLPSDCVVRGEASALYLFLWNRHPARPSAVAGSSGIEVDGDKRVLDLWHEKAAI